MTNPAVAAAPQTVVPAKIEAAQRFMYYIHNVRRPSAGIFTVNGDMPGQEIDLSKREQAAYDAALDVLVLYFRGEMHFGDGDVGRTPPGGEEEGPQQPVNV